MDKDAYVYIDGKEYTYVFYADEDGAHLDASTPNGNRKVDISYEEMPSKLGVAVKDEMTSTDWDVIEIVMLAYFAYNDTFDGWSVFVDDYGHVYKEITAEEAEVTYKLGYREILYTSHAGKKLLMGYIRPQAYVGKNEVFWKAILSWRASGNWRVDYIRSHRFVP